MALKKGESLYFVGDPNNDATGDNPWCHIRIALKNYKKKSFEVSEKDWTPEIRTTYTFGDEVYNKMDLQGMQNFYIMYLYSSNYTNDFPTFALKKMQKFNLRPRQWEVGLSTAPWMYARADGQTCLQAEKSFGVKWLCPTDGTYYVDEMIFYGTKQGYRENSGEDGICYGIYKGTENLTYLDKDATSWVENLVDAENDPNQHLKATVEMKKGEALFFTVDPKKVNTGDIPGIRISISTDNTEIDYKAGMQPFDIKANIGDETDKNGKTTLIVILIVTLAVSICTVTAVSVFLIKKRKTKAAKQLIIKKCIL